MRTVFSVSRASEFLELRALQTQTGQDADAFGDGDREQLANCS